MSQTYSSGDASRFCNGFSTLPQTGLIGVAECLTLTLQPPAALAGLIDEKQADKVFESANQSVVSIADYKVANGNEVSEGTGSGFMWDTYGHIVTNYHCVAKFATDQTGAQVRTL